MCANSLNEQFMDELKHAYYTEQQLIEVTEELASQSSESEIKEAFSDHHDETQNHMHRLEEVFDESGESLETKSYSAVDGLIYDHEEFANQDPDQHALDQFNIAAGQKSEHYEIAMYGNLIPLADKLGRDEVANTLEKNLREEQDALEKLSKIGEKFDSGQISNE